MALILVIETATKNCSLALCENGITIESIDYNDGNFSHAEKLHVFIEEILSKSDREFKDLNAIAVSKGPGSYTGLRIGVSACKGLCFGLNIPLIALETLEILARTYLEENEIYDHDLLIPMIDARRMEVYTGVFDSKLNKIKESYPDRISGVFGKGLIAALLFKKPGSDEPDHEFPSMVCEKSMQKGVLFVHTGRESIKFGPPLTITDTALMEGIEVLCQSIHELNQSIV